MNENVRDFTFLRDSIDKFKGEINKIITNNEYSNSGAQELKNHIEEIEKDMASQEKFLINDCLSSKNNNNLIYSNQSSLPLIKQSFLKEEKVNISLKYAKQSQIDRMLNPIKKEINEERMNYINNMKRRKIIKTFERNNRYYEKKNEEKLLNKYGITSNTYDNIKLLVNRPFMSPEKKIQYSFNNKNYSNFSSVTYDKNKQPIIKKEEIEKGLIYMVYRGIIPKGADLSPAFENNGKNPLQINMKIEENEENEFNTLENEKLPIIDSDNFFITKADNNIINQRYNYDIENQSNNNSSKAKYNESNILYEDKEKNNEIKVILFSDFHVCHNEEFKKFQSENMLNWGSISYLIGIFCKLFKKLNLSLVQVYEDKLLNLAKDEMKKIDEKDLLLCVLESDLKGINPNDPFKLFTSDKEKYIVKIQMAFRKYSARKKLYEMRNYFAKIKYIQHMYTSTKLKVNSRKKAKVLFENRYQEWKKMMSNFKKKWDLIKTMKRVIIHYNTISLTTDNSHSMNISFNQFKQRENNQLNRMIDLYDPNVEIIYISPYEIDKDIISYYTSILNTLGIEKINERFHFLIPDITNHISKNNNYSVSELLLLSTETLQEIKNIIGEKECYIIPGDVNKIDVEISIILNCPILMGDLFQSETIFSKSGSKLIFEANDINVPISAWNIKDETEFYLSLTHLIINYPEYNIWVFKMDHEKNGRGIAYIQLDKIHQFIALNKKKDNFNDKKEYENLLKDILIKMLPKKVKICGNYLYKSWEDYMKNYTKYGGIIEACPTFNLINIMGSPSFPILIEPNGNIEVLNSYDKINLFSFRNIGAISPEKSTKSIKKNNIDNDDENKEFDINLICEKIGKYLYEHDIIGYVTIDFIVFKNINNENDVNYCAIDIKFGLNDLLSSIKFCYFLYSHSMDKFEHQDLNHIESGYDIDNEIINIHKCMVFTFPFLYHPNISDIQMKNLVQEYRRDNLIFDLEKKNGIIFNFSDILKCGNMGLCGILNTSNIELKSQYFEIWKMIQNSMYILSLECKINEFQPLMIEDQRTDMLNLLDIFNKINKFYNNIRIYVKKNESIKIKKRFSTKN